MDDVDRAAIKTETEIDDAIAHARHALTTRSLQPVGACHWCNESISGQRLFCDGECADDYAAQMRRGNP